MIQPEEGAQRITCVVVDCILCFIVIVVTAWRVKKETVRGLRLSVHILSVLFFAALILYHAMPMIEESKRISYSYNQVWIPEYMVPLLGVIFCITFLFLHKKMYSTLPTLVIPIIIVTIVLDVVGWILCILESDTFLFDVYSIMMTVVIGAGLAYLPIALRNSDRILNPRFRGSFLLITGIFYAFLALWIISFGTQFVRWEDETSPPVFNVLFIGVPLWVFIPHVLFLLRENHNDLPILPTPTRNGTMYLWGSGQQREDNNNNNISGEDISGQTPLLSPIDLE
eukprot:TRINITY_DN1511_c0_g1_i1.p1 TRINITY_DN1511_c0_g1~~TRINITY_DN1511_c0_g1_i1.p1  ORF type:complete len:283 (-),score=46.16 TRINITY_DN1511_c0_g1_i1:20-868(-)